MTLLSGNIPKTLPKTFNLLSIGQRGVGKTVFLAGSYAELNSDIPAEELQEFWFDCEDQQVQQNIEKLLNYIAQTGQYPPPTLKITNFNFSMKRYSLRGARELCNIRWWDIPGEYCNIRNRDFQKLVLASHGCCVFISAEALLHDHAYVQSLENVVKQVMGIASLVHQHGLKYPFALIFTKCDLLQLGPISLLQLEQNLQPLVTGLEAAKANYKRFYSAIPIVSYRGSATLKAKGAAAPILWLTSELRKRHKLQLQQDLGSGLMQKSSKFVNKKRSKAKNILGLKLSLTTYKYILLLTVTSLSLLALSASAFIVFFSLDRLNSEQAQVLESQFK